MEEPLEIRARRALFERCPGLRCALGGDGSVRSSSAALDRAAGGPGGKGLRGARFLDCIHPDDRAAATAAIAITREAGSRQGFQGRLLTSDGRARRLGWTSIALKNEGLTFLTAEELPAAPREMRRFRALVDAAPSLIGVCALPGDVVYLNPAARRVVGVPDGDLGALHLTDLWPRSARSRLTNEVGPALRRDGTWSGDAPIRRSDGAEVPLARVVMLLRDDEGRAEATGTVAFDVSVEARDALVLRRFRALAETTSDLIATATIDGSTTYVNPAGMKLLGRAGGDFRTLRLKQVIPRDMRPLFHNEVFPTAIKTGLWAGDTTLLRMDGSTFPVSQVVIAIRDESGELQGLGTIARDTSERVARSRALALAARGVEAPILQVWRGVLALPVVGLVDEARAAHMKEALLQGIVRTRSRVAILDLTGMVLDEPDAAVGEIGGAHAHAKTAEHLLSIAKGASLLGGRCFLSGVTSAVARAIAGLDVDLSNIPFFATLEQALRAAMVLLASP